MMGIYIKVMTMPEYCAKCPMCHRNFDGEETRLACYVLKAYCIGGEEDRSPNCPLAEIKTSHGRLIDANKIIEAMADMDVKGDAFITAVNYVKLIVEDAPTVIEAEGK